MIKKMSSVSEKITFLLDFFFIAILFLLPSMLNVAVEFSRTEVKMSFVAFVVVWCVAKLCLSKLNFNLVSVFDVVVVGLFIYSLYHFYFLSDATFWHLGLWVYVAYFILFYLYQLILSKKKETVFFVHNILILIVVNCAFQALMGVLQYFELIEVKHDYFKLLGTFTSPNFLAGYLSFGFTILIWYFFVQKIEKKSFKFFGILILVLLISLIVLSNSRGTWLATISGVLILLITNKKNRFFLKKLNFLKILLGVLALFLGFKYLYELKPESVKGRIFVSKISLQEIVNQPITGHGLFSFAGKYNVAKADYFMKTTGNWSEVEHATYVPAPFNDYLLIAFELGLPVLFVLLILLGFIIVKTKINSKTRLGIAIVGNLSVWALFNSPSYNILLMTVGLFGLALIFIYGDLRKRIQIPIFAKRGLQTFMIILGCLGLYIISIKVVNERKFHTYGKVQDDLEKKELVYLSKFADDNLFSDYKVGKKLYDYGQHRLGIDFMEKSYKKSSSPKIGRQLAFYHLKENNYKRAEEIYRLNINLEPYRYQARMDMASLYGKFNCYRKLVKLSQEIVDFPVKVPSKKIRDYKRYSANKIKAYSKFIDSTSSLKGSLSNQKLVRSTVLNKSLPYKIYLPSIKKINRKLPVLFVNDGYDYIQKGKLPQIVDNLIELEAIEPIAVVFLDSRDKNENWKNVRQELFSCNPIFEKFFTDEFVPLIESRYPISSNREDRTILGSSLGGVASLYLGMTSSNFFKNIAMQCPSFHSSPEIYKQKISFPNKEFRMYLSYSKTEKDTLKQNFSIIKTLENKEEELNINCFEVESNGWEVLKEQIDDMLVYFFGFNK